VAPAGERQARKEVARRRETGALGEIFFDTGGGRLAAGAVDAAARRRSIPIPGQAGSYAKRRKIRKTAFQLTSLFSPGILTRMPFTAIRTGRRESVFRPRLEVLTNRRVPLKGRVLIIDDEAEIRRNLTVGLTQEGYTAVACPDGISAIHELNAAREKGINYDYLVTDIFMPDIDGLKILKVIKIQYPEVPVLVITGFGDESLKLTALSEHNTGYLDKPFEIPDLVEALEALSPGSTDASVEAAKEEPAIRESVSAYLTIRITDPGRSMEIYQQLYDMPGVQSCEAVRGDFDIIVLAQGNSRNEIDDLFDRIGGALSDVIATVIGRGRDRIEAGAGMLAGALGSASADVESALLTRLAGGERLLFRGSAQLSEPGEYEISGPGVKGDYAVRCELTVSG